MATIHTHQLAAIMFSDIVGYTALMGSDEAKGYQLLQKNREIQKPLIEKHHGIWIKEMGDGMMARFDSAYNAARCAIEIQQKASKDFKGRLRIGLHLGDILVEGGDIFGDDVNIASRIESIADPGSIYISEPVHKALQSHADIQTNFLGPVELKNVQQQVKIYYLTGYGLATPSRKKIKQIRQVQQRNVKRKRGLIFASLFLIILSVLFVNYWLENHSTRKIRSIAVLPFDNFTGNVDEQYFVDMIHDAVITELSQISKLIVISRTSTKQFKNTTLTIPEIARILNVDAVIESSVFATEDSVLLQVQLIQARPKEGHIWAQEFARDIGHIFSLYGELAKSIAREVEIQLTPREQRQLTHEDQVNPEAYKAYLQGRFQWEQLTPKALETAEYYFNKAREIDPNYAPAYVGLATINFGRSQMGLMPWYESTPKSIAFLEKAYELDNQCRDYYFTRGAFDCWGLWNFEEAKRKVEIAISEKPNNATFRVYYAHMLCILNQHEAAIVEGQKAVELDPYNNLTIGIYGMALNFCRQYDKAEKVFLSVLENQPYNSIAISNIKSTYHNLKEYDKAVKYWRIDHRNDTEALQAIDRGYAVGRYHGALKNLAELMVERSKTQFVTPWRICTLYTRAGMKEEALEYLAKSYEAHDQNMPYIGTDPIFDYMRDDPRFQGIIKKMNFPN
jgi:class 3 adenylate cyclase/TolB-like protein